PGAQRTRRRGRRAARRGRPMSMGPAAERSQRLVADRYPASPMRAESADIASEGRPRLLERLPAAGRIGADEAFDRFVAWAADAGLSLYPAQEQALLELWAGKHVVLSTPTGSGKSLVALGLHWKALCEGRRSFYTAPMKALVSEKFFALCNELGPANVGM